MRTLSDIHKTVKEMLTTLEEMNIKSAVFWAEFKRDFPEFKLDEKAYHNLVCLSLPPVEPRVPCEGCRIHAVQADPENYNQRLEVVEAKLAS